MLKVNIGLSRKLTRDYNSTGFSLNLEGELNVGLDDPAAMVERIKEYYDLAEEALNQQIERYAGESAIASRDEPRLGRSSGNRATSNNGPPENGSRGDRPNDQAHKNGNSQAGNGEAATNKQVQYLLNLGKRQGLTPQQLEGQIAEILGRRIGVYDLTKREAGDVIDALSQNAAPASNGNRNRSGR